MITKSDNLPKFHFNICYLQYTQSKKFNEGTFFSELNSYTPLRIAKFFQLTGEEAQQLQGYENWYQANVFLFGPMKWWWWSCIMQKFSSHVTFFFISISDYSKVSQIVIFTNYIARWVRVFHLKFISIYSLNYV